MPKVSFGYFQWVMLILKIPELASEPPTDTDSVLWRYIETK